MAPTAPAALLKPVAAAAAAEEDAEAAAPDAVLDAMLIVIEPLALFDEGFVVLAPVAPHVAVKPVAFVHAPPRVEFEPETKLTGAHCHRSISSCEEESPRGDRVTQTWYNMPSTELSMT